MHRAPHLAILVVTSAVLLASGLALPFAHASATEGVVLSGGGARGIAHVGALVGLKRLGHNPEIVLGTSMGSIVGALYAAGDDPDSIWAILKAEDWRALFVPLPAPVGPWRAPHYAQLQFQGAGGGLAIQGLISDWRINRELVRRLFGPSARARGNFDLLPRRFRSVAADLETGSLVAIGFGDLARSARASMASGGFFSPVRWGDRLLVDGGVYDYLPVDEARRIGATYVIAVDALRPGKLTANPNALTIADRSIRLILQRSRVASATPDALVVPDLEPDLSPMDYPVDPTKLMEAGLTATLRDVAPASGTHARSTEPPPPEPGNSESAPPEPAPSDTSAISEPADSTSAPPANGDPEVVEPPPTPDRGSVFASSPPDSLGSLTVDASGSPVAPFLERAFEGVAPAPYDSAKIFRTVDRLYVTGLFTGIWPSVEDSTWRGPSSAASGQVAPLVVRAEGKGKTSASAAAGYDNDRGGRIWGSVQRLGRTQGTPVELGLEGSVNGIQNWGDFSIRVPTLGRFPTAWTAGAFLGESEIRFLPGGGEEDEPDVKRGGGWVGVEWRVLDPDLEGTATLRAEHIDSGVGPSGSSYGAFGRVGVVAPNVEIVGTAPMLEGEIHTGDVHYARVRAKASLVRKQKPLTIALLGDVEAVTNGPPLDSAPALGNDFRVPALRWGEHRGRALGAGGIDVAYPAKLKATLCLRLRGGAIADEMQSDGELDGETTWVGGAGLSALWWTMYGRIEAGFEASTLGDRRILVRLGSDF